MQAEKRRIARLARHNYVLHSATSVYGSRMTRVKDDCVELLRLGYELRPSLVDLENGGETITVITLSGNIPSFLNGEKFNVPVTVWITEHYPEKAPPVYISPSPGTMMDPYQRCIDDKGSVNIPYLSEWNKRCNIVELAKNLSIAFSHAPPLFEATHEELIRLAAAARAGAFTAKPPPLPPRPSPTMSPGVEDFNPAYTEHGPASSPTVGAGAGGGETSRDYKPSPLAVVRSEAESRGLSPVGSPRASPKASPIPATFSFFGAGLEDISAARPTAVVPGAGNRPSL